MLQRSCLEEFGSKKISPMTAHTVMQSNRQQSTKQSSSSTAALLNLGLCAGNTHGWVHAVRYA